MGLDCMEEDVVGELGVLGTELRISTKKGVIPLQRSNPKEENNRDWGKMEDLSSKLFCFQTHQ